MDLFEAIDTRYSYRGEFTEEAVTEEAIQRVVESAIRAPSACNRQGPRFVVVRDPKMLAAIAGVVERPVTLSAKAMIVLLADHREVFRGIAFGAEDCAAAAQNMLLSISALGYASVWIDGALRFDGAAAAIAELLNVPPHLEVHILLPMGVPANPLPPTERMPLDERVCFEHC
jgi:nitroreductase